MTERLGLSIVIVNWNTRDLLVQLLADLTPWTYNPGRHVEVIVVDNASRDGSVEAVIDRFPNVKLLAQDENLGFARGVNAGVAAASNELVLLLNTDLVAGQRDIELLCRYMERDTSAAIAGPRIQQADGSLSSSYWRFPSVGSLFLTSLGVAQVFKRSRLLNSERYAGECFENPTGVDVVSGCAFLVRRDVWDSLGGFDEEYFMYFEETDLCHRARLLGYKVRYAPVARFTHFGGGSSRLARLRTFLDFRRSSLRYFRRYHGKTGALLARAAHVVFLGVRMPVWALLGLCPGRRGRIARSKAWIYTLGIVLLMLGLEQRVARDASSSDSPVERRQGREATALAPSRGRVA